MSPLLLIAATSTLGASPSTNLSRILILDNGGAMKARLREELALSNGPALRIIERHCPLPCRLEPAFFARMSHTWDAAHVVRVDPDVVFFWSAGGEPRAYSADSPTTAIEIAERVRLAPSRRPTSEGVRRPKIIATPKRSWSRDILLSASIRFGFAGNSAAPRIQPGIGVRWPFDPSWAIEGQLMPTAISGRVRTANGVGRVTIDMSGGEVGALWTTLTKLRPALGLGLGIYRWSASGEAEPGFSSAASQQWALTPIVRGGVELWFETWMLGATVRSLGLLPRPRIQLGDGPVARDWLEFQGGLEAGAVF